MITITINDDSLNEINEMVILELSAKQNCALGSIKSHSITINDDDVVPDNVLCVDSGAADGVVMVRVGRVLLTLFKMLSRK
jgi:hypothetical protein